MCAKSLLKEHHLFLQLVLQLLDKDNLVRILGGILCKECISIFVHASIDSSVNHTIKQHGERAQLRKVNFGLREPQQRNPPDPCSWIGRSLLRSLLGSIRQICVPRLRSGGGWWGKRRQSSRCWKSRGPTRSPIFQLFCGMDGRRQRLASSWCISGCELEVGVSAAVWLVPSSLQWTMGRQCFGYIVRRCQGQVMAGRTIAFRRWGICFGCAGQTHFSRVRIRGRQTLCLDTRTGIRVQSKPPSTLRRSALGQRCLASAPRVSVYRLACDSRIEPPRIALSIPAEWP
eukprot:02522_1